MANDDREIAQADAERTLGSVFLRWLPALTAIIAAITTVVVALISWNASRSTTDKDYVSLAMDILSDKASSVPSRRWAVAIVSNLSPVDIPPELASGLVSGRSVLPSELDPNATRAVILTCLEPVFKSDMVKPLPAASLPTEPGLFKDWVIFADKQTGQLDKANSRIEGLASVLDICVRRPMDPRIKASGQKISVEP